MTQSRIISMAVLLMVNLLTNPVSAQKGYTWKILSDRSDSAYFDPFYSPFGTALDLQKSINGEMYAVVRIADVIRISKWNGSAWSSYPDLTIKYGLIHDITMLNNELYISGNHFDSSDLAKRVNDLSFPLVKFNGTKWDTLNGRPAKDSTSYMNGSIHSLTPHKGKLYFLNTVNKQTGTHVRLFEYDPAGSIRVIKSFQSSSNIPSILSVHDSLLILAGGLDTVLTSGITFYDGNGFTDYLSSEFKGVANLSTYSIQSVNDSILAFISTEPHHLILLKNGVFYKKIQLPEVLPYDPQSYLHTITSKDNILILRFWPFNSFYRHLDSNSWVQGRKDSVYYFNQSENRLFGFKFNKILSITHFVELVKGANIDGTLFVDLDSNCMIDSLEPVLANTILEFNDGTNSFFIETDEKGHYDIALVPGNYTLTYHLSSALTSIAPCNPISINIVTDDSVINDLNIPVHVNEAKNLGVNITCNRGFRARQGFDEVYTLKVTNHSLISDSVEVELIYPSKTQLTSYDVLPVSHIGNTLAYKFYNLGFNESREVKMRFSTSVNTSSINDEIKFYALIRNSNGDTMPENNVDSLCQKIVAAYDPNIKQSYPEGRITERIKKIKYVIHFQNTGNDTAFKVVVTDTITDKLGLRSIRVTGTSHPSKYAMKVVDNQVLVWTFENIMLPDSHINEKGSHGFIAFESDVNSELVLGDSITNKAYIYFDYQKPIITNTASIVMTEPGSDINHIQIGKPGNLQLFPNPTTAELTVVRTIKMEFTSLRIYDQTGREVLNTKMQGERINIDVSSLMPGIYFVKTDDCVSSSILLIE